MSDDTKKNSYKKSTFSRTALHCGGVSSETRRQILTSLLHSHPDTERTCDIYVILPDVPHFFWKNAFQGTYRKNSPLRIKYNIYTTLSDEDVVLLYLEEAVRMKARALILSAAISPLILKKLEEMAPFCGIFLLSEYASLPNSFYFGSDAYRDGFLLGKHFCRSLQNRIPLILDVEGHHNIQFRIRGFCDALAEHGISYVKKYTLSLEEAGKSTLLPSKIASLIAGELHTDASYCLYISFGTMCVNRILQKIKSTDRITCLCHDCVVKENGSLEEGIAVSLNQDILAQGKAAIRAAEHYVATGMFPDQKYNYIPSKFYGIN